MRDLLIDTGTPIDIGTPPTPHLWCICGLVDAGVGGKLEKALDCSCKDVPKAREVGVLERKTTAAWRKVCRKGLACEC